MFGGMDLGQLMNNPMVQQMMQQMAENPQMLADMIRLNPMFANNPMFQQLADNPEALQEQMRLMQQFMGSGAGTGVGGTGATGATGGTAFPNPMAGFDPSRLDLSGMMNNPMVQQMINQVVENPQALGDMMRMNPMFANNPVFQELARNPEQLREQVRMAQQFMGSAAAGAAPPPAGFVPPFGGFAPPPQQINQQLLARLLGIPVQPEHNRMIADRPEVKKGLSQVLQGILMCRGAGLPLFSDVANIGPITTQSLGLLNPSAGAGAGAAEPGHPPAADVPVLTPEQRFGPQLTQMNDMGFLDNQRNVEALVASNGNVSVAIEWLLNH
jgi:ubiquilin